MTDRQWERLEPLLPPEQPEMGRPNVDHRRIINGILWRERTGAPWRDRPARYGPWSTVYSRFWRWQQVGVWARVFAAVQQEEDAAGAVDWDVQFIDSSVIRAHQHAAAAKGGASHRGAGHEPGRLLDQGPPQGRGGGKPLPVLLTPGQRHESTMLEALLDHGAVRRLRRGWPHRRNRAGLRRHGIRVTSPKLRTEHRAGPFDHAAYRRRHLVENLFARGKQFRALATRYDKRAASFQAAWVIVMTILWLLR